MASPLSHFDKDGRPTMVDVSEKTPTHRIAIAEGTIRMHPETLALVQNRDVAKGDVCTISELAGIMGAKKTADLIPLCHPLALTSVKVEIKPDTHLPGLRVTAVVKTSGKTGVEMEALTAVSIACLTIYDMLKAAEKSMVIDNIHLVSKSGGKSGPYEKSNDT